MLLLLLSDCMDVDVMLFDVVFCVVIGVVLNLVN